MSDPIILPFCGAAPLPGELWSRWILEPGLLLGLALLPLAFHLMRRVAGGGDAAGDQRFFYAGLTVLVIAFVSPLCALSAALFSARVGHHLLLIVVAAPLIAMANPFRGRIRLLTDHLGLLLIGNAVATWFWHAPMPYEAALRSDLLYWTMQGSLLGTSILFWAALLDPRTSGLKAGATALGAMMQMGLLGALLTFAPRPLYAAHALTGEPFGFSALTDQQLAGLLMWAPGALPYLLVAILAIARVTRGSEEAIHG